MSASLASAAMRPSGRDEVTYALLSATEELCTVRQPSSFTVADIAREANTTTSLLYFYFDSKDDIILATLRWIASDLDALAAEAATPGAMAAVAGAALADRPAFARIISWLILEGRSVTDAMGNHPFLRRLMTTLAANASDDPRTRAGVVVSILLSQSLLSGTINVALGRESDDQRLPEELDRVIATVLNPQP